jgi:hypothetical protein
MNAAHLDSDGIERVRTQWGFNAFTSIAGVVASVRGFRRKGPWYIWRLPDGSFDYTANKDFSPDDIGWPTGAELVQVIP